MRLSNLFSRRTDSLPVDDRAGSSAQEPAGETIESSRDARPKSNEFRIQVGEVEKHLLEGRIDSASRIVLTVDTRDVGTQMRRFKGAGDIGIEVCEGDIGVYEKLIVRIECEPGILGLTVRVLVNGRLLQVFKLRPVRTFRDVVFQTLMPGLFILLVAYYAFAYRPEVADFYCGKLLRHGPPPPVTKPHAFPGKPEKQREVAIWVELNSTQSCASPIA